MSDWRTIVEHIHVNAIKHSDIRPWSTEDARFLTLALCGEVGELANLIKKQWRGRPQDLPGNYDKVREEIADIAIYTHLLAMALGFSVDVEVNRKLPAIQAKYQGASNARPADEDGQREPGGSAV